MAAGVNRFSLRRTSDPTTAAAAPPAVDDLSYFNRLEGKNPQPEKLKAAGRPVAAPPASRSAAAAPAAGQSVAVAPPAGQATTTPRAATPPADKEPALAAGEAGASREAAPGNARQGAGGYAVQIAALNLRSEADAIAKKLSAKGYAAYVLNPPAGTPQIYRVRIGKYGSRREAETIATKLEKEEQFKPWVTR